MESSIITLRRFLTVIFLSGFLFLIYFFVVYQDKNTKLVFCDVGQGDAAYIRVKNRVDVLVDAGPDRKVLTCLGKYMPFWDRKIELAIISHPQKDHFGGFLYLLDRYQIGEILMTPLDNPSQSFKQLKEKIAKKKVKVSFPQAGERINILSDTIEFYWPTEEFIAKYLAIPKAYLNHGRIKDTKNVLGVSSLDDNNFSLVFLFEENYPPTGGFRVLFTGDATPKVFNTIASHSHNHTLKNTTLLKIPHHGSKNGLTKNFLELANPKMAVISVGKNNPYGHPTKEILNILQAQKIKIRRTDIDGNIVFRLR